MKHILAVGFTLLMFSDSIAGSSRLMRVTTTISTMEESLNMFKNDVGRYPSTEEGLTALVSPSAIKNTKPTGYIKKLPKDPWGYVYHYQYPGTRNKEGFDLWSNGADGLPGGDGFDSDVGNWPGGSEKHRSAISAVRREAILDALPMASLIGVVFASTIYLGICLLRISDGVQRRKSFTGKSIWIGLFFFALYWFLALPLIVQ